MKTVRAVSILAIAGALGFAALPAQSAAQSAAKSASVLTSSQPAQQPEHLYPTPQEEQALHDSWYKLVLLQKQLTEDQAALSKAAKELPEWKKQEADSHALQAGIEELKKLGDRILADHAKGDPAIAKKFAFNPQTAQFDPAAPAGKQP